EQGRLVGTYAVLPAVSKFKETARMQDEFLSRVTHDLKAPLASISSALEIIAERTKGRLTPDEERFVDISVRNTRTLKQMIGELLDFSRLSSGRLTVKPEPCAVESLLRESVDGLKPWADTKRIGLDIDSAERVAALPRVSADAARVVETLNNLVSNAIKFTPEGGHISVSGTRGEETVGPDGRTLAGQVVLSVRDDGCGISEEDQKRLFERFSQLGEGSRRREGVGLGLAIVKELVALHGGQVWVRSEAGAGATFFFSLPAAA
ncbi:MAG: HAMP domain-containing histidine kinase, partial [Elusimicrobia bacterium]|nr:HAMP domain-containing histidine kinase [Elusimicrobiota bacterium]